MVIHGIGRQTKDYSNDFIKKISQTYQKSGKDELVFKSICWQEIIQPAENALFEKISYLKWRRLRNLLIGYGGDALCYQPSRDGVGFYSEVHDFIDSELQSLYNELDPDSPVIIIAHSLGSIVISNFLWDSHNKYSEISEKTLDLLKNLKALYTLGSPLSIWSLRFPGGGVPINIEAEWFNVYHKNDIISSPIKLINQHYTNIPNLFDIELKVGNMLTFWNPLVHNCYWSSSALIKHLIQTIERKQ